MKKRTLYIVPIVVLVLIFAFYLFLTQVQQPSPLLSPLTKPAITNCSNDNNITALWSSIYKESAPGIISVKNSSDPNICTFYAYKKVENITYTLAMFRENGIDVIGAMQGNLTDEINLAIETEITPTEVGSGEHVEDFLDGSFLNNMQQQAENRTANISAVLEAKTEFERVFNFENQSAFSYDTSKNIYKFTQTSLENNNRINISSSVYSEKYANVFVSITIPECTPNWTAVNTSCRDDEIKIQWFNDTKQCGTSTGIPSNVTWYCDDDGNNIIGTNATIDTDLHLGVSIADSPLNLSRIYTQKKTVEIKQGSNVIVEFVYNFTAAPLNFYNIEIIKQSSSSKYGYLIVNGISESKTLKVDKKNESSEGICIQDETISSVSDISSDCDNDDEFLISCPGEEEDENFACEINDDGDFVVSGLEHSGVREYLGSEVVSSCTTNWTCSGWGVCNSTGFKTQTCIDTNSCGVTTNRPSLVTSCTPPDTTCTPLWDCSDWSPAECTSTKKQTRTCTDTNQCTTLTTKTEERSCTPQKSNLTLVIIILSALILLAILAIVLFIILGKNNSSEETRPQINSSPRPPYNPFNPPVQTIPLKIQQPMQKPLMRRPTQQFPIPPRRPSLGQ